MWFMTTTTSAATIMSDAVWEAFIDSYEADHNATAALLQDPESWAAINVIRPDSAPEPFGSLSNVDDNLNHALNELHEATAKPLPHAEHPAAQLAKESGRKIHSTVVDADTQVNDEIRKLKDAKSLDTAAWNATIDGREKKSDEELIAANHNFWEGVRARGVEHPKERGVLLEIADAYSKAAKSVINFLKKAAEWLIEKLNWVWNKIKEMAGWVWDKIKLAAKAVAHFFGF